MYSLLRFNFKVEKCEARESSGGPLRFSKQRKWGVLWKGCVLGTECLFEQVEMVYFWELQWESMLSNCTLQHSACPHYPNTFRMAVGLLDNYRLFITLLYSFCHSPQFIMWRPWQQTCNLLFNSICTQCVHGRQNTQMIYLVLCLDYNIVNTQVALKLQ